MEHVFLHVDLDAFFASVEQLDHPEWKGLPIIVGGKPGDRRSVVSTASYEARKYGVHSAMPTFQAVKLCPNGIFVHGRHKRYQEKSAEVMSIFSEFSPDVIQISVDEAFIDLTGTDRLFGDPEQTAQRIKNEVKKRTGLTVSVGMAATKYIAKIASGLHKPDGFIVVPHGKETEFMLSLPLEKVWGAGTKTLEKLRSSGLNSPADIYRCSEQLLISIFGQSGGSFLYNAVRGNEVETFTSQAKSHQLSSENTFDYDLADSATIDTALLELSHTVLFRLLRENLRSRTVALKIRYEDFTTVSIQETSGRDVSSVDDLFERAKSLFAKKYDQGKGIRLLGLGVQNTESALNPRQGTLFDFGEEKKQKVEKAILAAEEKFPNVSIKKARLLGKNNITLIFFLPLAFSFLCAQHASASETETATDASGAGSIVFDTNKLPLPFSEAAVSLYNIGIGDSSVEFKASGYWQSTVTNTTAYSFGFGTTPGYSTGVPVFTQNVDLSLWFLLNNTWYFESSFADGFEKNTVAAGYYGQGYLKEARIANRGIVFPSTYSADKVNRGIGGGDNQAPGISFHFEDDSWKADAVLRYDMLEAKNKTWYGKNSVSEDTIALGSYLTGRQFILPSADITAAVSAVYVESSSGTYSDKQNRKYKKLDSSKYLILPARCEIVLSSDAGAAVKNGITPSVAVSFDSSISSSSVQSSLGSYGTAASIQNGTFTGSGFLGAIQEWFASLADSQNDVSVPNLASFSYGKSNESAGPGPDSTGTQTDGFFTSIGSDTVLIIQHPAGFSPFAACFRYDCGSTSASDALVTSAQTGTSSSKYVASITDDDTSFVSEDFFSSSHTYADIYYSEAETSSSSSMLSPQVRYPLAGTDPGVYLGSGRSSDFVLSVRTYTAVERFDIGTKAVPGTVTVYKNGVIDSGAVYSEEAGTITLSSAVSSGDRIYAEWYEDSGSADSGAIAAAAGFEKLFSPSVTGDISFAFRWSYAADKKFADSSYASPGFLTLASSFSKKTDTYSISNTAAATLESTNTTGSYRILGMGDSHTGTVYLASGAGTDLPSGFVPVLNRRPSLAQTMPSLTESQCCSVSAQTGKNDSGISGYAVPVSWNFSDHSSDSSVTDSSPVWACTAINLPGTSSVLASSSTFSIALKNAGDYSGKSFTDSNLSVYLQLGVDADDDFTVEDSSTVPTWLISKASSISSDASDITTNAQDVRKSFIIDAAASDTENKNGWQTVTVVLTDEDKARLSAHYDARIVICSSKPSSASEGTIYAGPYEAGEPSFSISSNDAVTVSSCQKTDSSLSSSDIDLFNSSTNYVQYFDWSYGSSSSSAESAVSALSPSQNFDIVCTRYFEEADISPYTTVSLWFNYNPDTSSSFSYSGNAEVSDKCMTLVLDRPQSDGSFKRTVVLSLYAEALSSFSLSAYHHLTIDRSALTVSIDGKELPSSSYALSVNDSVVPVRMQITLNSADAATSQSSTKTVYRTGSLDIDELTLSGSSPHFILQDKTSASWKKDGVIISAGTKSIVSDASFTASGTGSSTIYTTGNDSPDSSLSGSIGAGAVITGLKVSADASHNSGSSRVISSGGHSVETAVPLFGIMSFGEQYRFSSTDETLSKKDSTSVSLSRISIPLTVSADISSETTVWSRTQTAAAKSSFNAGPFALALSAEAKQKLLPSSYGDDSDSASSYTDGWEKSNSLSFSTGKSDASRRSLYSAGSASLSLLALKPSVEFSTQGTYVSSSSVTFTDDTVSLFAIPFTAGKNSFSLSWKKAGGGTSLSSQGGNYYRDKDDLASALSAKSWYFIVLPFYDLFSTKLSDTILSDTSLTSDSAESLYYTGTYAASWKRTFSGTRSDLYLPSSVLLSAARDIRTSATVSDVYQIKAVIGWTALNIFGSTGTVPFFSWYQQDEYTSSLSAVLKIPHDSPSDSTMKYTGYVQANYYVNGTNTLKTGLEGTFENSNAWDTKATLVWKRRGKMSPVLAAVQLFRQEYTNDRVTITRTDSMNTEFSESESSSTTNSTILKKQSYALTHLLELGLTKYVTVNGSITGSYSCTWNTVITLSASGSLGCTIKF
jgi:nucleotidyltransferase/DNA polymerase involved in DNA repair